MVSELGRGLHCRATCARYGQLNSGEYSQSCKPWDVGLAEELCQWTMTSDL